MPTFDYICPKEHTRLDKYVSHRDDKVMCEECGEEMEKTLNALGVKHIGASAFPFITTHLNGEPIEVKSASHLESLCKQYGKVHRPDVGWITQRYEGYDWRAGKQKYTESSGVGLPGCWI